MHSQYVFVLKILQNVGYAFSVISGILAASGVAQLGSLFGGSGSGFGAGFLTFLTTAITGCVSTYVITQGLISIVDLLDNIEANTRKYAKLIENQKG